MATTNDSLFLSKIKTSVDRCVERINTKLEKDNISYIVEMQSMEVEGKEKYMLFLVVANDVEHQVLLNIPVESKKSEHKAEAYLKMFTILVDLGLQSLVIMTQEAIAKQQEKEASEKEDEAIKV